MSKTKRAFRYVPYFLLTVVILSTALLFSGCEKTVIDIKGAYFLDVSFDGCNKYGKAVLELDMHNVNVELNKHANDENYSKLYDLVSDIKFKMEDPSLNGKLSNNDTFNVVAVYDEDLANEINVTLNNTTITCTVKNLKDGIIVDAFKDVKVTFGGKNGKGYVDIDTEDCDDEVRDNVYFTAYSDTDGKLSNGDTITVKAETLSYFEKDGYFLREKEKTYTVSGLTGPRDTLDGVDTSEIRSDMQNELNYELEEAYNVCNYDYEFTSGKKRHLSYDFTYTTDAQVEEYQYVHSSSDLSDNALIAYYKLSVTFNCKDNQSHVDSDETAMKKNEKDTGVTYIAVISTLLDVTEDNKVLRDDYTYYTIKNGASIEEIKEDLNLDGLYISEYYDSDFKKKDNSSKTNATEKSTQTETEKSTQKTTEKSATIKSSESVTETTTEKSTEKVTKS